MEQQRHINEVERDDSNDEEELGGDGGGAEPGFVPLACAGGGATSEAVEEHEISYEMMAIKKEEHRPSWWM